MRHNKSRSKEGFFLFEMSVVLLVVLLGCMLIVPSMLFLHKTMLTLHLEHIKSVSYYIQCKAMIEQQTLMIRVDLDHHTLKTPCGPLQLPLGSIFGTISTLLGPPSKPHKLITRPCSFVHDTIYFYPDGTTSAGTLYIVDTADQSQHALTIVPDKGCFIRKYRYASNKWHAY